MKHPLPNILNCTAFKKHVFIHNENKKRVDFSKLFLYLPSTLDKKEEFLQWKDHAHLHPINATDHLEATDHQVITFAQDLFVAFCSVLVRMYLNITTDHFSEIIFDLKLMKRKLSKRFLEDFWS